MGHGDRQCTDPVGMIRKELSVMGEVTVPSCARGPNKCPTGLNGGGRFRN